MRNWIINQFEIKIFVFFLLLLSIGSGCAFASTYYIANTGSDSNAGTETKPFLTIQKGVDAAQAGDTVLVYPGTYKEGVEIRKSGTAKAPITIKAQYPARIPLDGSAYAETESKRSAIDASGKLAGFYNDSYQSDVGNIIIDGFYIHNGTKSSIYFFKDHDIWLKNNMAVNNGYDQGENYGNYYLVYTPNSLLQNNYSEFSVNDPSNNSANSIPIGSPDNIVEYNEVYVNSHQESGRGFYVTTKSANLIFRYNYQHFENRADAAVSRFRDTTNFTIENNYLRSRESQYFFLVHENYDNGIIEKHKINNNTFAYEKGGYSDYGVFGFGYLDKTEVKNNIFYSGIKDKDSYAIRRAWHIPSYSVNADKNIFYNFLGLIEPALKGFTETNTQNTDPDLNLDTGCSESLDNNVYGSNLDVSQIPYRKCDGTFYPAAGKFGIAVTVRNKKLLQPLTTKNPQPKQN